MYLDDMKKDERRNLRVLVKCYADVTSAIRVQDARIRTLENRSNVPESDIFPQDKSMWEQGSIASADGSNIDSKTRLRSYFVPIKASQKYKCKADTSHELLIRMYTANKTYRGNIITSFASADFEFTTDATDKYIRFVIRNSSDATITSDELDNVCWSCEPVIEDVEQAVDTTEPTATIKALGVKAIAYTQGMNGKGEWDGTLEFKDVFGDIPLISDMSVITFGDNLSVNTQIPATSSIAETFGSINIKQIYFDVGVEPYTWDKLKSLTWNETKTHTWKILKEG